MIGRRAPQLSRSLLATALVAGAALLVPTGASHALPSGTAAAGAPTLNSASGTSDTIFSMSFATTQFCPGDAAAGYRWGTFITPRSNDPATLTYSGLGSPVGSGFTASLRDKTGSQIRALNPGLTDGQIAPPAFVTFSGAAFSTLPAGEYWLGIACTKSDGTTVQTEKFWKTPVTIEALDGAGVNGFTYETGFRPDKPVIASITAGDTTLAVAFTPVASTPATTSFLVTATPTAGGTAVTQSGSASPITLTGLTNGVEYSVSVNATNAVGTSDESAISKKTPNAYRTLTVSRAGVGSGSVSSAPTGISCGPTCTTQIVKDSNVTLTANASAGSTFTGWSGDCSGTATTCDLTMGANRSATANFALLPTAVPGNKTATLSWSAAAWPGVSAITDYVIERSTDGVKWTAVKDPKGVATSFLVKSLKNGTAYRFRVAAKNASSQGPWLQAAPVTPRTVAGAPRSLAVVASSSQLALTWRAPSSDGGAPVTDYVVQYSTDGKTWLTLNDTVSTALSATIPGLVNGVAYKVKVAAVNAAGTGKFTAAKKASPKA